MATLADLKHAAVMPQEAVAAVLAGQCAAADSESVFVDATFGAGGHSRLLLQQLAPHQRLLALDCDEYAEQHARAVAATHKNFAFARRNFADLQAVLAELSIPQVCGVLFDLGVSSMQLDMMERGFSFNSSAPLDMRMDRRDGQTLMEWLSQQDEEGIARVIRQYGEEPQARRIARSICMHRDALTTTQQLADVVCAASRARGGVRNKTKIHPATKVFQSLRIALNQELEKLQAGLQAACNALAVGGRLVVIAFHSLEDRMVKRLGRAASLPNIGRVYHHNMRAVGKMQRASADEVAGNPRARSACMRVFVKVADASAAGAVV